MSEWLPIETAPKDGTEVLLIGTVGSMLVANPRRVVGHYSRGWWSEKSTLSHVTHWMPLPGTEDVELGRGIFTSFQSSVDPRFK